MKKLCAIFTCFILLFSFSACSEEKAKEESVKKTKLEVTLELNKEKSVGGRVSFDTNLPVGTLLDVEVFIGDKYHSSETVAVQADMYSNYFITETQLDESGKIIEDGNYIFSANLSPIASQPDTIKKALGLKGENLSGSFVYEVDGGKTVKLSKPLLKKNNKFTIPEN